MKIQYEILFVILIIQQGFIHEINNWERNNGIDKHLEGKGDQSRIPHYHISDRVKINLSMMSNKDGLGKSLESQVKLKDIWNNKGLQYQIYGIIIIELVLEVLFFLI